ncbi:MAG: ABC transporter ATP-binding protein [Bdellovibrionaceae bacterium]|nr:ABC transporter ATP-binding protein [Pseudobdellovibrionaceae bacterium]
MRADSIVKSYPQGDGGELQILRGLSLEIRDGEAMCILGSSGAGKSTFLQILGTLDRPQSGQLYFQERNILDMNDEEVATFRNEKMGFVFQFHHLLAEFTALENVMIPCRIAGQSVRDARDQATELLYQMGLGPRMAHYPSQLSGGELQRVAIARALVRRPKILFADEPTGNLDMQNSQRIQDLFFELKERLGLALVVVTHDLAFAQKFPKILRMKDGQWV